VESRKGMQAADIQRMPTQVVGAGGGAASDGDEAPSCAICLEEFAPGHVARRLPCCHSFHRDCVDKWLKSKATCPVCQRGIS
jgi:hypothetical protein